MISIPIQITKQEIKDFPLESLQIDPKWAHIIDPEQDHLFKVHKKATRKNSK